VKVGKVALAAAAVFLLLLAVGACEVARHWPFSQANVTAALQEDFPATVTFQKFHSTFFPHPGCVAEGLAFRRLGSYPQTPPIVTIQRFTVEAHYIDLLLRPGYLARIITSGFRVYVPPAGTPIAPSNWPESRSKTRVDEIIADGATVEVARANHKASLVFEVHALRLGSVSYGQPFSYNLALHNPLPPGEIHAEGKFGPWNGSHPGETPVSGRYDFEKADLSVFQGIAGTLSSHDDFLGTLGRMESRGRIDIPDFMVTRSKHSTHLTADYHAFVDGTNGDVRLERVNASFLKTHVAASGQITGHAGGHGKTAAVDVAVHQGRIQDVLRLFVREPKPAFNGITSFRAHVVIPPESRPFVQKVRLSGDFGVEDGQFTKMATQQDIDALSDKSRGRKQDQQAEDEDPERVISNVAGHVELQNGTATFLNLSLNVPGAFAHMNGTYDLQSEAVNLHGTLKTDVELSKMSEGIKSVLLKPFDVFFKRKHAGAAVPVHLIGTYQDPQAGLDLPVKASPHSDPKPAPSAK
jgi:AsmA-like C-terminal region